MSSFATSVDTFLILFGIGDQLWLVSHEFDEIRGPYTITKFSGDSRLKTPSKSRPAVKLTDQRNKHSSHFIDEIAGGRNTAFLSREEAEEYLDDRMVRNDPWVDPQT